MAAAIGRPHIRHGRAVRRDRWMLSIALGCVLAGPVGCAATKPPAQAPRAAAAPLAAGNLQLDQLFPELKDARRAVVLGDQALGEGKPDLATIYYLRAYDLDRTNQTALERLAAVYRNKRDLKGAEQAYRELLRLNPSHADANENLGLMRLDARGYRDAEQLLGKAVAVDPRRWRAWNGLGIIADIRGDHQRAADCYRSALRAEPQSPMLLSNLGYSYYLAGDHAQARRYFAAALDIDSGYRRAARNMGLLEARERNYRAAVGMLSRVMEPHAAYNDVGYISMLQGDYAEADRLLAESIRLSPIYYEKAQENVRQLRLLQQRQ